MIEQTGYYVTVNQADHGTLTADMTLAEQGDTVTVTAAPEENYRLTDFTAIADSGEGIIVGSVNENEYTFEMPASNVAVSGVFTNTVIPVFNVSLDPEVLTLNAGETGALTATVSPESATNKNVTWSSDNINVAAVDSDGKVTAKAAGSATITVTTEDGGKTATCKVTVTETKPAPDPKPEPKPAPAVETIDMYRMYNPNSGEHFYTGNVAEKNHLISVGWNYEGVGFKAPKTSNTPVYRLYNPNAGDHHYTYNKAERDHLIKVGWNDEGIGWYADDNKGVPQYRLYNPNAEAGAHHYTWNTAERDHLISLGWKGEGIGFYSCR